MWTAELNVFEGQMPATKSATTKANNFKPCN